MGGRFFLVNRSQLLALTSFPLPVGVYTVGRSSQCDLVIPDITISRRHAEIHVGGGEVKVVDLKSRNGTFVDEARVASCILAEGQSVRFGRVPFLLASSPQQLESLDSAQETADQQREARRPEIPDSIAGRLSKAQFAVVVHLMQGLSEKQTAKKLAISPNTVHHHVHAIYRILSVHSRAELLTLLLKS